MDIHGLPNIPRVPSDCTAKLAAPHWQGPHLAGCWDLHDPAEGEKPGAKAATTAAAATTMMINDHLVVGQ